MVKSVSRKKALGISLEIAFSADVFKQKFDKQRFWVLEVGNGRNRLFKLQIQNFPVVSHMPPILEVGSALGSHPKILFKLGIY